MTTLFSELYGGIRALLGDNDSSNYQYTDEVLNQHIELVLYTIDDVEKVAGYPRFTTTITTKQKGVIVFTAVKGIVSNQPNEFSYKTPILQVRRKGKTAQLLSYIDKQLSEIQGGGIVFKGEGELDALFKGVDRYIEAYDKALTSE